MRQSLSAILALTILARVLEADTSAIATQITAMPQGARIEIRLKNKEKLSGERGVVSDTGVTLVSAGTDRQVAFDDVASVKLHKSHTTRNVLIIVGIGVVATVGIIAAVNIKVRAAGVQFETLTHMLI